MKLATSRFFSVHTLMRFFIRLRRRPRACTWMNATMVLLRRMSLYGHAEDTLRRITHRSSTVNLLAEERRWVNIGTGHARGVVFHYYGVDVVDFIFRERVSSVMADDRMSQLSSVQAELGNIQLQTLDEGNEQRTEKGFKIYSLLAGGSGVMVPILLEEARNIFSTCPVLVKNKEKVKEHLLKCGVDTSAGYMQNCAGLEAFSEFKQRCEVAARVAKEILYLSLYPSLSHSEIGYISDTVKDIMSRQ